MTMKKPKKPEVNWDEVPMVPPPPTPEEKRAAAAALAEMKAREVEAKVPD